MTGDLRDLGTEQYIRLTTFRRDGSGVPTPVWLAADGSDLLVITGVDAGKVKRLRHTPRVLVAACDARGRVKPEASEHEAVATLIEDPAAVKRVARTVLGRYPLLGRVLPLLQRLRHRTSSRQLGIRIAAPPVT